MAAGAAFGLGLAAGRLASTPAEGVQSAFGQSQTRLGARVASTMTTVKYDASGKSLWTATYPDAIPTSIQVDGQGSLYVGGSGEAVVQQLVLRYQPDGRLAWVWHLAPTSHGSALALDPSGSVYGAAVAEGLPGPASVITKLSQIIEYRPDRLRFQSFGRPGDRVRVEDTVDFLSWVDLVRPVVGLSGVYGFEDVGVVGGAARSYRLWPEP